MITSCVRVLPVVVALLFLTACAPGASTAQTSQRLAVVQADIAQFESAPTGNSAQRLETVRRFALELSSIRTDTADPALATASYALTNLYWTIAHLAETNPLIASTELLYEVGDVIEAGRINEANETYLSTCEEG